MKYRGTDEGRAKVGHWKYLDDLRNLAKENRKKPTEAEEIVWKIIRKKILGYKFTRQKPIARFIVDFYCSKILMVIEVDGEIHDETLEKDRGRDKILSAMGIKTFRIKNSEIIGKENELYSKLKEIIIERSKEF
jgi:very-short-patch-repair endonuclease